MDKIIKEELIEYYGHWINKISSSGASIGGGCKLIEMKFEFIFKKEILN